MSGRDYSRKEALYASYDRFKRLVEGDAFYLFFMKFNSFMRIMKVYVRFILTVDIIHYVLSTFYGFYFKHS